MDPATILKLVLVLGVVLLVLAIGLRARPEDSLLLLRRPDLGVRALAAMFVLQPAFVLLVVWLLDLREGVGAALLGFAVAPVLPPWAKKGYALGAASDYVIGLEVLATAASILVVPVMIWIVNGVFGVQTALDPWSVELMLLVTIGLPLAVGMGLGRFRPASAPRLAFLADRAGTRGPPARRGRPARRPGEGHPRRDRPGNDRRQRADHRLRLAGGPPPRWARPGQARSARLGERVAPSRRRAPPRLERLPGARSGGDRRRAALPRRRAGLVGSASPVLGGRRGHDLGGSAVLSATGEPSPASPGECA